MIDLVDRITSIYPELKDSDFFDTIIVMDNSDGNGQYIAQWNHPTLSQPTQEELEQVSILPKFPRSVKMASARIALIEAGLIDDVEAFIDSIPDEIIKKIARTEWEYRESISIDSLLTQQLINGLNLSNEQVANLFNRAGEL